MTTKLRLLCLQYGPQYKIAASCDIPPSKISEYCLGRVDIPDRHLIRLCEFFRLNPEDILGESEDQILE